MLAAMHGKIYCVKRLLEAGANVCQIKFSIFFFCFLYDLLFLNWTILWLIWQNFWQILMFDSLYGRTCLHYAAYYGHADCVQAILSAAQSSPIAVSW